MLSPNTAPIRERLTEEAEQFQRLATGAQERDRMRNRSKRDF